MPVFDQDTKTPTSKPKGKADDKSKGKSKGKPKQLKGLSDFEKAAIERLKRFDGDVATALGRSLPMKTSKKRRIECVLDELKFVKQRRKGVLDTADSGFADETKIANALDKLDRAKKDLNSILKFYRKDKLPKWFIDLRKKLDKAKKQQKDPKGPTSKPTKQKPGKVGNGLIVLPDTLRLGLALPNGNARV